MTALEHSFLLCSCLCGNAHSKLTHLGGITIKRKVSEAIQLFKQQYVKLLVTNHHCITVSPLQCIKALRCSLVESKLLYESLLK